MRKKVINMAGNRFGRLVVTTFAGQGSHFESIWNARCDCGAEIEIRRSSLLRGADSCGCERVPARPRLDLSGQEFGRLTALRFDRVSESKKTYWVCRCECGAEKSVQTATLRSGRAASCGRCYEDACGNVVQRPHISYASAHRRLRKERGPARRHECADCAQPAADWSYDGFDVNELRDERNSPYSLDPDRYVARCKACHGAYDVAMRRARKSSTPREKRAA